MVPAIDLRGRSRRDHAESERSVKIPDNCYNCPFCQGLIQLSRGEDGRDVSTPIGSWDCNKRGAFGKVIPVEVLMTGPVPDWCPIKCMVEGIDLILRKVEVP